MLATNGTVIPNVIEDLADSDNGSPDLLQELGQFAVRSRVRDNEPDVKVSCMTKTRWAAGV